jgi:protease I
MDAHLFRTHLAAYVWLQPSIGADRRVRRHLTSQRAGNAFAGIASLLVTAFAAASAFLTQDNPEQQGASMSTELKGKKIAILATDGFEQVELTEPKKNLEDAGATVEVISLKEGQIKGWDMTDWGTTVRVDRVVSGARPADYDALVLPGGVINPDKLRMDEAAVSFVREFANSRKPVAAICHGPWTLIEAGVVKGRTMTSWPSLHTDLKNAGAHWVDQEVVADGNVITSRKPDDIPAFSRAISQALTGSTQKLAKAS